MNANIDDFSKQISNANYYFEHLNSLILTRKLACPESARFVTKSYSNLLQFFANPQHRAEKIEEFHEALSKAIYDSHAVVLKSYTDANKKLIAKIEDDILEKHSTNYSGYIKTIKSFDWFNEQRELKIQNYFISSKILATLEEQLETVQIYSKLLKGQIKYLRSLNRKRIWPRNVVMSLVIASGTFGVAACGLYLKTLDTRRDPPYTEEPNPSYNERDKSKKKLPLTSPPTNNDTIIYHFVLGDGDSGVIISRESRIYFKCSSINYYGNTRKARPSRNILEFMVVNKQTQNDAWSKKQQDEAKMRAWAVAKARSNYNWLTQKISPKVQSSDRPKVEAGQAASKEDTELHCQKWRNKFNEVPKAVTLESVLRGLEMAKRLEAKKPTN